MNASSDSSDPTADISVESVKRRSVQGAAATVVAQIIRFVIQFGLQIALVRLLDPSEFGLVAMAAPVFAFVQTINDLGLGQAIVQRPKVTRRQISAMFWVSVAISLVLTVVILLIAPLFSWLYGEPLVTPVIRALGGLVVVAGLSIVPAALLNRHMRFVPLAIVDIMSLSIGAVAGILAALNGSGYWSLIYTQAVTSVVSLVLYWWFAAWWPSRPAFDPELGPLLRFGTHLTGSNLASYVSTAADRILIGTIAGKFELGLYDRSYRLVLQPLFQVMAPVSRVAIPMLSRLHGSDQQFARAYLFMLQFTLLLATPGLLVNIVLAKPIVSIIFGAGWADASPIFAWICFGALATAAYSSTSWIFTSQGRTRQQMRFNVLTSAINVTAFAIGAYGGAVGVAAVSAVSFVFIQTPLLMRGATKEGAVSTTAVLHAILPFLVAGVITAGCMARFARPAEYPSFVQILCAEVFAYCLFCAILACQPAGRRFFHSTWMLKSLLKGAPG